MEWFARIPCLGDCFPQVIENEAGEKDRFVWYEKEFGIYFTLTMLGDSRWEIHEHDPGLGDHDRYYFENREKALEWMHKNHSEAVAV